MHQASAASGDAQILQMMEFASEAFRASSAVFYWVSDTAEMFGLQGHGVPDNLLDRYRTSRNRLDPLLVRRLNEAKHRVVWLREAMPSRPGASVFAEFLDGYDIVDNLEFVFWDDGGPFAGLGVLRARADPPLDFATMDPGALHKYFEFNMRMHPRQREVRLRATLARRFRLTQREIEAVSLLCAGASNHEIAEAMGVQLATVKTHVFNILNKLGVGNRSSVVGLTLSLQ